MKNHKKAFTLTELLVVVIVLGVLAGVCAPKFMRVLETRKTTEAEELLGAVRTEQEQRCVLGKSYLTAPDKVDALASAGHSKNYTYSLQSTGASASSKKGYTLKMLSYKEGSLCCEGEYCDKLNKSYPKCSDTPVSDECAGEISCTGAAPDESRACGCRGEGVQYRSVSCDTSDGSWNTGVWGTCSVAESCSCDNASKPVTSEACGNCGRRTRSVTCDTITGTWKTGNWSTCSGQGECAAGTTESGACGAGFDGTKVRTCSSSCQWNEWDSSSCVANCSTDTSSVCVTWGMADGHVWKYGDKCAECEWIPCACNKNTGKWELMVGYEAGGEASARQNCIKECCAASGDHSYCPGSCPSGAKDSATGECCKNSHMSESCCSQAGGRYVGIGCRADCSLGLKFSNGAKEYVWTNTSQGYIPGCQRTGSVVPQDSEWSKTWSAMDINQKEGVRQLLAKEYKLYDGKAVTGIDYQFPASTSRPYCHTTGDIGSNYVFTNDISASCKVETGNLMTLTVTVTPYSCTCVNLKF